MAIPLSYLSITLADNTQKDNGKPETTTAEVPITTITPANQAATVTAVGNYKTALAGLLIGRFIKDQITLARDILGAQIPATDELAQRENKYLFRYHDNVTFQNYEVSYGTADLSVKIPNKEFVDLTAGPGLAMKTAFEALVVSPGNSANAVTLDSIQFVGRNT